MAAFSSPPFLPLIFMLDEEHKMKLTKISLILLILYLNGGCYMKMPRLSNIEIARNYLIESEFIRASEIPIEECIPKHFPSFAKDFKLFRAHIGVFFPKDPMPSPIYI